jgi:predicted RND superfamily exporter protein
MNLTRIWHSFFHKVLTRPKTVIAVCLLLCLASSIPILKLTLDPSVDALVDPDSSVSDELTHFQNVFGNDELVIVAFAYPNVLSRDFITFIEELTENIKQDHAVRSVDSISHAVRIRAEGQDLKVSELFNPIPGDEKEFEIRKIEALNNKLYTGDLLNRNLNASSVLIRLKSVGELEGQAAGLEDLDPELRAQLASQKVDAGQIRTALVESLDAKIKQAASRHLHAEQPAWHTAGFFITSKAVEKSIIKDNIVFVPAATLTIILLLFIAFRNLVGIILPLAVVVLTMIPSIGLMSLFGIPLTMVNSFLPVVIMIIALADSIHILVKYNEESEKNRDRFSALEQSLQKIYRPCLYTSVTTLVGFLSLSYTDIPPVMHFGLFAGVGVIIAFLLTITFLPAVLIQLPQPKTRESAALRGDWMRGTLDFCIRFTNRWSIPTFIACLAIMVWSILGLSNINIETILTKFYIKDSKLVQDLLFIDDRLAGTQTVEIMLEALDKEGRNYSNISDPSQKQKVYDSVRDRFLDARMQQDLENFEKFMMQDKNIKKVMSIVDLTRSTKAAFLEPGTKDVPLPKITDEVSNFLFLLSNSSDSKLIGNFAEPGYAKARIMVRMRTTGTKVLRQTLDRIRTRQDSFGPDIKMTVTGTTVMSAAIADNFLQNQIVSFLIALAFVVVIIGSIYRSATIGALALIPNLFPILVGFLVMYLSDIDLNVNTVMVASIAIGLVVDDTIHFFHRLVEENRVMEAEFAINNTIRTVGRALGFTSFVLVGGFSILILSDFQGTAWLGLLLATVILWALLADLVLTPIVIRIFKPKYFYQKSENAQSKVA